MPKRGENIRKRKDGRWEGRYICGYDPVLGRSKYKSVYGRTYKEVKDKMDAKDYHSMENYMVLLLYAVVLSGCQMQKPENLTGMRDQNMSSFLTFEGSGVSMLIQVSIV